MEMTLIQAEREKHILNSINNAYYTFPEKYFSFPEDSIKLYIDKSHQEDFDTEIYMDINLKHYPLRDYKSMWSEMNNIVKDYSKIGKRNKHAVEHGKLSKHMMHLVRLYYMCFDILENEKIITYREKEHDLLMDIRNGKYLDENKQPIPEFFEMVDELEKRLKYDAENTSLPDSPDYKKINEFVMCVNERITALTIIVAAVPEGLPLIINLITAQNAKIMIKHNVLAKHTNKIPEAGNIQLLCTDKTGTLTVGKLVPVENVMGDGNPVPEGSMTDNLFKLNVALNSSAMYDENNDIVGGNATERALLTLVSREEYNMVTDSVNVSNRKSFNSANKFSAVETDGKEGKITYYKGAPEKLIDAAISYETAEGIQPIDKDRLKMIVKTYAVKAMRVIATGYSKSTLPEEGFPDDLILTSLVAIRDDVRPEVPEAVAKMHDAGVQVMMVTGDVIDTAKAIAKDAGLITSESDIAMSAIDFDAL